MPSDNVAPPWDELVPGVLAGLTLFLFGLRLLGQSLQETAGERMKRSIAAVTDNRLLGLLAGFVATTVLDSSSATIILVISLVRAGQISFPQALGVILGSNIGTTVSSQIFAFDAMKYYAPALLVAGFLLHVLGRADRWKGYGTVALSLGLVFFSLNFIGDTMKPLGDHRPLHDWLVGQSSASGVVVGAAMTAIIQSSSATVGIVVKMAKEGIMPLGAGIAIMLGAEVGTCADVLIASIGRERAALRTGLFQLLLNVMTVLLGIPLIGALSRLVEATSGDVGRQIANAHILFNTAGALLFLPFTPWIARLLERLIPDRPRRGAPGGAAALRLSNS
ncbi:Na/Pi cotransporter family protein [Sorangium sp. So ce233]|uniref:Na/Pi cotransporter family protein n=1 Tax=Sorangium sp. So ce233 TaxID=3133290 RepID=UPI003F61902D